jgi:siroheme synthase
MQQCNVIFYGRLKKKEFIQIIHNWCSTVNVKHPDKGKHLRDFHVNTIQKMQQENINYLKE